MYQHHAGTFSPASLVPQSMYCDSDETHLANGCPQVRYSIQNPEVRILSIPIPATLTPRGSNLNSAKVPGRLAATPKFNFIYRCHVSSHTTSAVETSIAALEHRSRWIPKVIANDPRGMESSILTLEHGSAGRGRSNSETA